MTSQKPYLIRAIYEWCQDNQYTPYLASAIDENVVVPSEYSNNKELVLNISFSATKDLLIDNEWITFKAVFNGVAHEIVIPIANVLAIFAKENSQGMQFQQDKPPAKKNQNNGLKLVK